MTKLDIQNAAAFAAGYSSYETFQELTGLGITFLGGSHHLGTGIYIDNEKDLFYKTMSSSSFLYLVTDTAPNKLFSNAETLKGLKTRIRSKLKQQRLLHEIKRRLVIDIKEFIADSFNIAPEMIHESDIIFSNNGAFSIGDVTFGYIGTLTAAKCTICTKIYTSYKEMYRVVTSITSFYEKKELKLEKDDFQY